MSLIASFVSDALNGMWRINVSGQIYGPYTGHQIRAFAEEGRLAPHSIVQEGEQGPWITAIDDPILGQLFVTAAKPQQQPPAARPMTPAAGSSQPAPSGAQANFVIVADLRARGTGQFEATLAKLGESYRLNQLVWILNTDKSAGALRNELVPQLGSTDSLFIVDANHGKTAWYNLGPEPDAKIRKVWKKAPDNKANN
ncbi:MAG: DUF4339 domain-containing protein [Alphaproteobacteria bacterium]|nr:DUF4339 domain-containing protein [Alphaproteobacteria bacterium]